MLYVAFVALLQGDGNTPIFGDFPSMPVRVQSLPYRCAGVPGIEKDRHMQVVHSVRAVVPRDRLLRLPDVEAATGCKKSTIYKLMKEGGFPRCVYVTSRMVAWPESAVLSWVQARIEGAQA